MARFWREKSAKKKNEKNLKRGFRQCLWISRDKEQSPWRWVWFASRRRAWPGVISVWSRIRRTPPWRGSFDARLWLGGRTANPARDRRWFSSISGWNAVQLMRKEDGLANFWHNQKNQRNSTIKRSAEQSHNQSNNLDQSINRSNANLNNPESEISLPQRPKPTQSARPEYARTSWSTDTSGLRIPVRNERPDSSTGSSRWTRPRNSAGQCRPESLWLQTWTDSIGCSRKVSGLVRTRTCTPFWGRIRTWRQWQTPARETSDHTVVLSFRMFSFALFLSPKLGRRHF